MREKIMMPLYDYMACMDYMNPDVCHQQCFKLKNFLSRPEMLRKIPSLYNLLWFLLAQGQI